CEERNGFCIVNPFIFGLNTPSGFWKDEKTANPWIYVFRKRESDHSTKTESFVKDLAPFSERNVIS
ncbi:unnamed protein product, partial [marine sediment metagenome]